MVWNFQILGCRAVQSFARDLPFASPTFSYPSHNIIPSSTSSPPLDTIPSQASLPPETSKTSSTYPRAVHWLRADFQISRTIAVSVQNTFGIRRCIKVCGRGGVVFTRRGGSAITILHSTGIGRDVARLNSKLPRKLPLFPASQLRPTVLFHARFIDPRTILPRPPTQTRFRPVALSYAVMVSTVSLLLSPLSFFPRSENSKLFASVRRSSCRVRACLSGNGKGWLKNVGGEFGGKKNGENSAVSRNCSQTFPLRI